VRRIHPQQAAGLGIRVGASNDGEVFMVVPARVPREVRCWFETELYKYKGGNHRRHSAGK